MVLLSACAGLDDGTTTTKHSSPPNPFLSLPNHYMATGLPNDTYLAIGFEISSKSMFLATFHYNATWKNAGASWEMEEVMRLDGGHLIVDPYQGGGANILCVRPSAPCETQDLNASGPADYGGTLEPGRYVAQVAAFSATRAALAIDVALRTNATVLWIQHGKAELVRPSLRSTDHYVAEVMANEPFYARVSSSDRGFGVRQWNITQDFSLAANFTPQMAGPHSNIRWHDAVSGTDSYWAGFVGPAGFWQFQCVQDPSYQPVACLVGIVSSPRFANQAGEIS